MHRNKKNDKIPIMDYKSSGVNIDAGNTAVKKIQPLVKKTFNPLVLNHLGGYAGMYELPKGYDNPVLVSCTDGVGTKLKLAIEAQIFDTVGVDLVAMCVNDLICCGAKPLYFLDYIACHALDPDQIESIVSGMTEGCLQSDAALIGGEMAEMNDLYRPNDFDLAGFSVGVVEKAEIVDGSKITAGQKVWALPAAGFHSNGFSLLRKVLTKAVREANDIALKDLLKPTKIYVKEIETLKAKGKSLSGLAHITGGGLVENIDRILPEGLGLDIKRDALRILPCFEQVQRLGGVEEAEMFRVFNMGIGFVIISPDQLDDVLPEAYEIGITTADGQGARLV